MGIIYKRVEETFEVLYGLLLLNIIIIILFVAVCVIFFIGGIVRFFRTRKIAKVTIKRWKRNYKCQVTNIKLLRTLRAQMVDNKDEMLHLKLIEIKQNLYQSFGLLRGSNLSQLCSSDFKFDDNEITMVSMATTTKLWQNKCIGEGLEDSTSA